MEVDDGSLPWHTTVTVSGLDRPGALASVAAAFSAAGLVVHGARSVTSGPRFTGRFGVTDRHGRKLDERAVDRLRGLLTGDRPRRSRFAGR